MARLVKAAEHITDTEQDFLPQTHRIAAVAADHKAFDIRAYDLRGLTLIADSFVICTTSSEPQLRAVVNAVKDELKLAGARPLRMEGTTGGGWVILDYGAVILHVFREEPRSFYDLDTLWADAPAIPLDLD